MPRSHGYPYAFRGSDHISGKGYLGEHLDWDRPGVPANIVEEYITHFIVLYLTVGVNHTRSMELALVKLSNIGVQSLAIVGFMIKTGMAIRVFQFRFGNTDQLEPHFISQQCVLVSVWGVMTPDLPGTRGESVPEAGGNNICIVDSYLEDEQEVSEEASADTRLPV